MATQALNKRDVEAKHGNPNAYKKKGEEQSNHKPKGDKKGEKGVLFNTEGVLSLRDNLRPLLVALILDHSIQYIGPISCFQKRPKKRLMQFAAILGL